MEALSPDHIVYPDSDGKPLADNTAQYRWIVVLKENLEALLPDDFVGGNLLWYAEEGKPSVCAAPDVMVALGRPKGERSSYKQWEEEAIAPQVVFEVLSPGNRTDEMAEKRAFYQEHGVEEYYVVDPDKDEPELAILEVWVRRRGMLQLAHFVDGWRSPRLGIRWTRRDGRLGVWRPDGTPFVTFVELMRQRDAVAAERDAVAAERDAVAAERDAVAAERDAAAAERDAAAAERDAAAAERDAVAAERDAAAAERDAAAERSRRLVEQLRALGLVPEE